MYYIIALIIMALDQVTKYIVVKTMELGERIDIVENLFYITSHRNRGAAWGILQGQMWFFYLITVAVIVGIVFYLKKAERHQLRLKWALSFMLGGAVGNFIDRVYRQEVVDFAGVFIGNYAFPIFNIADVALTIGVALICIEMVFEQREQK